eukprot:COSAG02_NODE_639_length_19078_cov_9.380262_6_plen_192_part_00
MPCVSRFRRQTLSESVWRRSVRDAKPAKCPVSHLRNAKCPVSHLRNAKCPVSHLRNIRNAKFRFRTCEMSHLSKFALVKCTVQIVPAPKHFARTLHARECARVLAHARAPPHAFHAGCIHYSYESILYIVCLSVTVVYRYTVVRVRNRGGRCSGGQRGSGGNGAAFAMVNSVDALCVVHFRFLIHSGALLY